LAASKHISELSDARKLQLLIDSVVDHAIYMIDLDGRIASWNSGAERLKGYKLEEIIGEPFSKFCTPEDQERQIPKQMLEIAAKEGRHETEGWRVRCDGSRFWALAVLDAIHNEDGELIGFAKVTRDITERMEAQRNLQEAQERLALGQRMEAIGQLSGGIAHDFSNLLMIVIGNIERAQRVVGTLSDTTAANLRRYLDNAMRGAQRATTLTHRLLAFARRQPLSPRQLDLNKFLAGFGEFLQRSLGEAINIEVAGAAGLWLVEVDPAQLESALVNLSINARDAMPGGGKLTIEALNSVLEYDYCQRNPEVTPGQYVSLSVTDTGIGMPEDIVTHAFEPFFTTKDIGQGTGLGLSQVYGFVKQSGGHVKIYSEVGQGTTVKIYLPRLLGESVASDVEEGELQASGNRERILVVEDDQEVRTYLIEVLREWNYHVLSAANAVEAIGILERRSLAIDLLLTDVVLPGSTGRDLANQAKALRPGLKILFMSGYSRNAVVHHGRVDPGVKLLQKPISQTGLARRLRELLDDAGQHQG
jgi:PAS domain S-box-containing protein